MKMRGFFVSTVSVFIMISVNAQKYVMISPDKKLNTSIEINESISVSLSGINNTLFRLENLSLQTGSTYKSDTDYEVQKVFRRTNNEIIKPEIREKFSFITNEYNELEIRFKNNQSITFRLFNEGLAYRFSTFNKDSLKIGRAHV